MSKKYGFQYPVYEKPTGTEIVESIIINLMLTIGATAIGIKMYKDKNSNGGKK